MEAPWDVREYLVDDWSIEFEEPSLEDVEQPPSVTFGDDAIVVTGATEFSRAGCDSLAPRLVSASRDGRVAGVRIDAFETAALEEDVEFVDCGDSIEYVGYELQIVPREPVGEVERVVVDERFEGGDTTVEYRNDPSIALPPEIDSYEFESIDEFEIASFEDTSFSGLSGADPVVGFLDGELVVEGGMPYSSSECGTLEVQTIDRVDGTEGHVEVRVTDGLQEDVLPGQDCSDDEVLDRYRVTLQEADEGAIDWLTAVEDGYETSETTVSREAVIPDLPAGVEDVSLDVEVNPETLPDEPTVSFEDRTVVVESGGIFPQTCYRVDLRRLDFDPSTGVLDAVMQGVRTNEVCGDAETAVGYELRVTLESPAETVVLDEEFDPEPPVVRHDGADHDDLSPEISDYEFEIVDESSSPSEETTVDYGDEEVVVEGTVRYGSGNCNRVALADLSVLEYGHAAVTIAATRQRDRPTECEDDENAARYRLTLSAFPSRLENLTVLEREYGHTAVDTFSRYVPRELPDGVEDLQLLLESSHSSAGPEEPTVEFQGNEVVIRSERRFPQTGYIVALESILYDESDGTLALSVGERQPTGVSGATSTWINYELRVTTTEPVDTVFLDESMVYYETESPIARHRDGEPTNLGPAVVDYEFERLEEPATSEPTTVEFDREQVVVEGTVTYGSELCDQIALGGVSLLETGHVAVTVGGTTDYSNGHSECIEHLLFDEWEPEATEREDLTTARYRLTLESDYADALRAVTVTEVGHETIDVVSAHRYEPTLPEGVIDYELETGDPPVNADELVKSEPDVAFEHGDEHDTVVLEGVLRLSSGTCQTARLTAVEYETDDHLAVRVDDAPIPGLDDIGCTADAPPIWYRCELVVTALPQSVTAAEGRAGDDEPLRSVTVEHDGDGSLCASTAAVDGHTVCDLDGDGNYRDVTNSGDVTTQDLQLFFEHQHRDPWDSRTDLFDFTDNDDVGQPDVVDLFHAI